jgi:hypothetical protein
VTSDGITKFKLKWCPTPVAEDETEETYEPIETIQHLPLLMKKYQMREELKFRRRLKKGVKANISVRFQFPKIKTCLALKLKHPAESYIPQGCEKIEKILEEIETDTGVVLWLVKFEGMEIAHFVNKQRILYYFPLFSCLYINECSKFKFNYEHQI